MQSLDPAHRQSPYAVRLDWGPVGAEAVAAEVCVVVDVLSFTTTLTVALERGITVHPYRWQDERAAAYAAERGATLAVGRLEALAGGGGVSLSPAAMRSVEGVTSLVLPSPNGSSISFALAAGGSTVVAACLRNRAAVASWLGTRVLAGDRVAVVAAGERWPDGSLRPAVEDLWGAGAVVAALADRGVTGLSPEARAAAAAYRTAVLPDDLLACAGGVELADRGFADDVHVAAELDASAVVPVLRDGAYLDARHGSGRAGPAAAE